MLVALHRYWCVVTCVAVVVKQVEVIKVTAADVQVSVTRATSMVTLYQYLQYYKGQGESKEKIMLRCDWREAHVESSFSLAIWGAGLGGVWGGGGDQVDAGSGCL